MLNIFCTFTIPFLHSLQTLKTKYIMNTTTNSLTVKRALHKKIRDLFDKQQITMDDIQDFNKRERACLAKMAESRLEN